MNLYIIIPAFNEKQVIGRVIREIRTRGYHHVVVVDDGSTDGTGEEARRAGATVVLRHRLNRGKGAAVKTGMEAAKRLGADSVITFDGDGQHDAKDIALIEEKISSGYDVVLGSRFLQHQNVPFYKRVGNMMANLITFVSFGIWVTDSQSGLRGYTMHACASISTQNDRYEIESEALREVKHKKLKYIEIPMHARYSRYSQQKKYRQSIWSAMMTMVRLVFMS